MANGEAEEDVGLRGSATEPNAISRKGRRRLKLKVGDMDERLEQCAKTLEHQSGKFKILAKDVTDLAREGVGERDARGARPHREGDDGTRSQPE